MVFYTSILAIFGFFAVFSYSGRFSKSASNRVFYILCIFLAMLSAVRYGKYFSRLRNPLAAVILQVASALKIKVIRRNINKSPFGLHGAVRKNPQIAA